MNLNVALLFLIAAPWLVQDADPIRSLITDLGDESATVRESAFQALVASGPKAIPRLRAALLSWDVEVQQRALRALSDLELNEKLAGVMNSRPSVTLCLQDAPFSQALQEVARQTGIRFEGVTALPGCPITAAFARAPLMQVLDVLATSAGIQWSFEDENTVLWRKTSPLRRPRSYSGGFRTSLSRIDLYRTWDYQQGHGLLWVYLETRTEPGIRPVGSPRFEVSDVLDEAGNELPKDADIQGCSPKDGIDRMCGAVYESGPFTIRLPDRPVKRLSRIRGQAIFLFPLDKAPVEIVDLCEESSTPRGELVFETTEILTSSLKLTVRTNGSPSTLYHHVDADSLVLIDAEGREYVRGADFDVRAEPVSVDTLCYHVGFSENVCFQPVALRFMLTERFFEKVVPFEFLDVPLP